LDVCFAGVWGGADHERDRVADEEGLVLRGAGGLRARRRPPGVASGCSGRLGVEVRGQCVAEEDARGVAAQMLGLLLVSGSHVGHVLFVCDGRIRP
jgi:hypothetical protein